MNFKSFSETQLDHSNFDRVSPVSLYPLKLRVSLRVSLRASNAFEPLRSEVY